MLAAEQMRAAGDVEQDAVGHIERDQRRIALAPFGDGFDQPAIGRRIFGKNREIGMHGAGLRQRHPGPQAAPLRRRGNRDEFFDIAALGRDGEASRLYLPLEGGGRRVSKTRAGWG